MAQSGGSEPNFSQWDAPTLPPTLPPDAVPPPLTPPLTPQVTGPVPSAPYPGYASPRYRTPLTRRFTGAAQQIPWRRVGVVALLLTVLLGGLLAHRLWDFGSAISTQNPLTTQTGYMTGGNRINVLVMGYGGGVHQGADLTDSMILLSLNLKDNATTMISVPRDLWVQVPPDSGQYAKLNTAYQDGLDNGYNGISASPAAGGAEAVRKIDDVTGLKVNYWMTLDFTGFLDLVDALGGVDIDVPVGWTATNLGGDVPGGPTVTFKAGEQHMDGVQALQYARARYITNPASEGTDFARSRRQLVLMHAIVDKLRSIGGAAHGLGVLDALQKTLYTNLSFADLSLLSSRVNVDQAALVGLTNDNVLEDAVSDDGQDILEPQNGDWSLVQQFVAKNLKP